MRQTLLLTATTIFHLLLAAVPLALGAAPFWAWCGYFSILFAVLAVLAKPVLACLTSVAASAEAQTAEDRVRKAVAERRLARAAEPKKKKGKKG